jgi:hypothetical protein
VSALRLGQLHEPTHPIDQSHLLDGPRAGLQQSRIRHDQGQALSAHELSQVRRALGFLLAQQEPFPALLVDRHWNVLMQNEAAGRVFTLFLEPDAIAQIPGPPNAVRLTFHPQGLRRYIANSEAVAGPLIQQIHRGAVGGIPDQGTQKLFDEVLSYPGVPTRWRIPDATAQSVPFLPLRCARATSRYASSAPSPRRVHPRTSRSRSNG